MKFSELALRYQGCGGNLTEKSKEDAIREINEKCLGKVSGADWSGGGSGGSGGGFNAFAKWDKSF